MSNQPLTQQFSSLLEDLDHEDFTATYSVEDNKLRIYAAVRFDESIWHFMKEKLGFSYAPKQELFYASWSPDREDFCLALAVAISPEETTLAERAEAKAERLDQLALKRAEQAEQHSSNARNISQRFEFGQPILVGHHSERKARKDKERMESAMEKSVAAYQAVDYWSYRAEGVVAHANQKANTRTRANRIKTLFEDFRGHQRAINHANITYDLWSRINEVEDKEEQRILVSRYVGAMLDTGYASPSDASHLFNIGELSQQDVIDRSLALALRAINNIKRKRYISHILNRIAYETGEQGGTALYEDSLTTTILKAFLRHNGAHKPEVKKQGDNWLVNSIIKLPLHISDDKTLVISDEHIRYLMKNSHYSVPAPKKRKTSAKGATLPLINPSQEQAALLQKVWNEKAKNKSKHAEDKDVVSINQMTYSANSKGDYALCKTIEIDENGQEVRMVWKQHERVKSGVAVARVRVQSANDFYSADRVIHINDKATKALPITFGGE